MARWGLPQEKNRCVVFRTGLNSEWDIKSIGEKEKNWETTNCGCTSLRRRDDNTLDVLCCWIPPQRAATQRALALYNHEHVMSERNYVKSKPWTYNAVMMTRNT